MKHIILIAAAGLILSSCREKQPDQDLSIMPANTITTDAAAPANTGTAVNTAKEGPAELISSPGGLPSSVTQVQTAPSTTTSATPATAAGMNPAHGQPGHRCDIPVGAPLNTPAGTNNNKGTLTGTPTQIAAPAAPKAAAPATNTAGLNPAHGQPGHRCDIPVGTPLSTPVKAAAAAPVQQQNVVQANAAPAATPASGDKSTVKLNPAHGEPGHKCEIAVGAPLSN